MKYVVFISCLVLLVSCSKSEQPTEIKPAIAENSSLSKTSRLNSWLDDEFAEYLDFSPLSKTRLGDKSDYDKLNDVSEAMMDKVLAWRRASVAEMKNDV